MIRTQTPQHNSASGQIVTKTNPQVKAAAKKVEAKVKSGESKTKTKKVGTIRPSLPPPPNPALALRYSEDSDD